MSCTSALRCCGKESLKSIQLLRAAWLQRNRHTAKSKFFIPSWHREIPAKRAIVMQGRVSCAESLPVGPPRRQPTTQPPTSSHPNFWIARTRLQRREVWTVVPASTDVNRLSRSPATTRREVDLAGRTMQGRSLFLRPKTLPSVHL